MEHEGVPKGTLAQHFCRSQVFPGTERSYWVYVPQQYDGSQPAAVMVFLDGAKYVAKVRPEGPYRAPIVLDNLIHKKELPIIIGIFIEPGTIPPAYPHQKPIDNRGFEYNTTSDQLARFLLQEILPEVGKTYKLTDDPNKRAICGSSSGGVAAFTVAWERPDAFRKVVSHIGAFVNVSGGHLYPFMIRKSPRKPIRVFLQDGANDTDNRNGSLPLGNQEMAAALKFARYDYKFVFGDGEHTGKHAASILPDTLRWLWREDGKTTAEK
jgi:enterochelin esterase family protein